MFRVWDELYFKLRKEEIEEAKKRLKNIKVDTIFQSITKNCWEYNIEYDMVIKNKNCFLIKLKGVNEANLLKYHNTEMVFSFEVDKFINDVDESGSTKGIYITTGEFNHKISEWYKNGNIKKDIVLEDNFQFIKNHIGLKSSAKDGLEIKKLNFFKYLPS